MIFFNPFCANPILRLSSGYANFTSDNKSSSRPHLPSPLPTASSKQSRRVRSIFPTTTKILSPAIDLPVQYSRSRTSSLALLLVVNRSSRIQRQVADKLIQQRDLFVVIPSEQVNHCFARLSFKKTHTNNQQRSETDK